MVHMLLSSDDQLFDPSMASKLISWGNFALSCVSKHATADVMAIAMAIAKLSVFGTLMFQRALL